MKEKKKDPGYTLAIIARNCAANLKRLLENYGELPDEIVVVNTGVTEDEAGFKETNEVAEAAGAKVYHFPWVEDFAAARNFCFDKCTQPFIFWLDTDDVVENPARCDQNIRMAIGSGADCIFMEYVYEKDRHGNVVVVQRRERVVRRGQFRWADSAPIHEVLVSLGGHSVVNMPAQGGRVIHDSVTTDVPRVRERLRRNKRVFEHHFGEGKKPAELRMIFYWANTLLGLGDVQGALEKYLTYLKRSETERNDHAAERMQALISVAHCYEILDQLDKALVYAQQALLLSPHSPTPYVEVAKIAMRRQDFASAAMHAKLAQDRADGMAHELASSPREIIGRTNLILAHAACSTGHFKEALEFAEKALPFFQSDPQFLQLYSEVKAVIGRRDLLTSFTNVRSSLLKDGKLAFAREMTRLAPDAIAEFPDVQMLSEKKRPAGKRSIAIVCFPPEGHTPWGPWSIKEGVGGSEEAVINASAELAKLGWHVEVYGHTGRPCKEGPIIEPNGVHWYRHEAWSAQYDEGLDVAISWRAPSLFAMSECKAKVKICWLHDIFHPQGWRAGCESAYDAFFLLSDYHRSLFPMIPDDKVFLTGNGIDPSLLVPLEDLKNEPHRMIWGSDPSRGLQFLLPWWKQIREAVPDATLDIFYGWSQHFFAHMSKSKDLRDIYEQVQALVRQEGITWRGKVGQDVLSQEYARASLFPYMSDFPEIYCISAVKAQANGCVVLAADDFALKETVIDGNRVKGPLNLPERQKDFIDRVIAELRSPTSAEKRQEMARWARSKTWASTVSRWHELFLKLLPQPIRVLEKATSSTS